MSDFGRRIRPFVDAERAAARERRSETDIELTHLARAHVLGQASTREHVRLHCKMLQWVIRNRDAAEIAGQLLRIVGAATAAAIGVVPTGNTGGASVSAWRKLNVPHDLAELISRAQEPGP